MPYFVTQCGYWWHLGLFKFCQAGCLLMCSWVDSWLGVTFIMVFYGIRTHWIHSALKALSVTHSTTSVHLCFLRVTGLFKVLPHDWLGASGGILVIRALLLNSARCTVAVIFFQWPFPLNWKILKNCLDKTVTTLKIVEAITEFIFLRAKNP